MEILKSVKTKQGNEIQLIGENRENNVLVVGVFHGEEPQGKFLIEEYFKRVAPLPNPLPKGAREYCCYHSHNYTNFANEKAKDLRIDSTDAENKLWSILRKNNLYGYHFKRQKPIGPYIVDFVCLKENLIIELDGSQHLSDEGKLKDKKRTKYLENLGYKVIRILDNDVLNNIEGSIEYILSSLAPLGRGLGRGANNLLFIPCLNPDGMARNIRTNSNGVDLNRNFPTKNWKLTERNEFFGGERPASEIETQFVIDIIEKYKPKFILTLHAPFRIVNYDGPAKDVAEKISEIIKYPVEASIGYPTPGSFGTYCGIERNIPTITLELDEECPVEKLVEPVHKIFDTLCNI